MRHRVGLKYQCQCLVQIAPLVGSLEHRTGRVDGSDQRTDSAVKGTECDARRIAGEHNPTQCRIQVIVAYR
ncbi:MAG: hypothetical protein WDN30_14340 [Pararobbsia sp.]